MSEVVIRLGVFDYGASEASGVLRRITEISEYERPAGRPAGRGHAFARLISQQPLDRFTCGNFCRVASFLLPSIGLFPMHVGDPLCTCHVQNEEVSLL